MLGGAPILLAQALALVHTALVAAWNAAFYLPIALVSAALRMLLPGCDGRCDGHARFYEVRSSTTCAGLACWPEHLTIIASVPSWALRAAVL